MKKTAVVFPGQGAQYLGMGADLYSNYAPARLVFDTASEAIGYDMSELCFRSSAEELQLTEHTQPAILVHSIAAWQVVQSVLPQLTVQAMAGLSLGEFSALVAAQVLDLSQTVVAVRERGAAMQSAVPVGEGAMAAILGLAPELLEQTVAEVRKQHGLVEVANYNSPGQIVISGRKDAVEAAIEPLKAAGAARAVMLPVSAPFHCALLQPAADKLASVLEGVRVSDFHCPVVANVTAMPYISTEDVRPMLVRQVTSPVRWEQSIRYLLSEGFEAFLEVGPGTTLSQFIRRIARDAGASVTLASLDKAEDIETLVQQLA